MANITMRQMLESGLHFGHQTRRWNPKMKPYIFGARNGIYIIDLQKSMGLFNKAYEFVMKNVALGSTILFVGTKKQAQDVVREEAERCGMFYVNHRWLGGMLTNFQTIKKGIERLRSLETMKEDGTINRFAKKEVLVMEKEIIKLNKFLGGIKTMKGLPGAIFIVDPNKERIAVTEASKLGIPVIAIADTNCDPDGLTYIIPGNDDAIRAIKLITSTIADAALAGKAKHEEDKQAASDKELEAQLIAANTPVTAAGEDEGPSVEQNI